MHHPVMLIENVPLAVARDGNCLYCAVSRGLFKDERYRLHIWLLVAIKIGIFLFLFYLYIYPPDSQESDGGANT